MVPSQWNVEPLVPVIQRSVLERPLTFRILP